jgi:hypothetical protein
MAEFSLWLALAASPGRAAAISIVSLERFENLPPLICVFSVAPGVEPDSDCQRPARPTLMTCLRTCLRTCLAYMTSLVVA